MSASFSMSLRFVFMKVDVVFFSVLHTYISLRPSLIPQIFQILKCEDVSSFGLVPIHIKIEVP